jgi:hypothetical protein
MRPGQRRLLVASIALIFMLLIAVAILGWWNFIGTQMVSRGDIREASYHALEFDNFFERNGKGPTAIDIESFSDQIETGTDRRQPILFCLWALRTRPVYCVSQWQREV